MEPESLTRRSKLGTVSGVYIPVCLNIISILLFLRFSLILGQVGLLGILGTCSLLCSTWRRKTNIHNQASCSLHTLSTL